MSLSGNLSSILGGKGRQVFSISPDATVFEAIQIMADKNIGALLVMSDEKLIGVISERDYTRKVALKGKSSKETRVKVIVSSPIVSADSNCGIEEAMRLMTHHRVRHLPVLEGQKV